MPQEGYGALIAGQWIVTVIHCIFYKCMGAQLNVGSKHDETEKYIQSNYVKLSSNMLIGDFAPLMEVLKSSNRIDLIKCSALF